MHANQVTEKKRLVWHEVLFRGVIWSLVGALYAAVFVPVFEVLTGTLPVWLALGVASVAATAGGALVYSSAQLAFQVAVISNVAVFGYTLVGGATIAPLAPVTVGAGAGAAVGALYGLLVKKSKIYRADARLLSGIVAGGTLSVIGIAWVLLFEGNLILLVALLAPLSGLIYERIVNKFVHHFSDMLPAFADGAVAGAVIGGLLGLGLWVMGGAVLENVSAQWLGVIKQIAYYAPLAIAAAAGSTFVAGMLDKLVFRGY